MQDFLGRLDFGNFKAATYITDNAKNASALPNIAIAVSGGGYRALMNGGEGRTLLNCTAILHGALADSRVLGGAIQAFDSREENSTGAGHLGGVSRSSDTQGGGG